MKKSSKDFKETLKTRQKTVFCKGKIKNKSPNVRETEIENICKSFMKKVVKTSQEALTTRLKATFATENMKQLH